MLVFAAAFFLSACGGGEQKSETTESGEAVEEGKTANLEEYDPNRGEGEFSADNVVVGALDNALATKGEAVSGTKCLSCHKTTDERLVGPGWAGVTTRKSPHWIMNFITNPDPMIDKDPEIQAQLEICLVRMPNQNLEGDDARSILEFMRKNDGVK